MTTHDELCKLFLSNNEPEKITALNAWFECLPDLEGKYYECIYDEKKQKYCGKPHYHKIINAWNVHMPDYIFNGIALQLEFGLIFGAKYSDIFDKSNIEQEKLEGGR